MQLYVQKKSDLLMFKLHHHINTTNAKTTDLIMLIVCIYLSINQYQYQYQSIYYIYIRLLDAARLTQRINNSRTTST